MTQQAQFPDLPPVVESSTSGGQAVVPLRLSRANRQQVEWRMAPLDDLLREGHPARSVWKFVAQQDLSDYVAEARAIEGHAGRPAIEQQAGREEGVHPSGDDGDPADQEQGHRPAHQLGELVQPRQGHPDGKYQPDGAEEDGQGELAPDADIAEIVRRRDRVRLRRRNGRERAAVAFPDSADITQENL